MTEESTDAVSAADAPGTATRSADREAPAGTDSALEIRVWLRLLTCSTMIERHLRRLLKRRFDTTMPRFDALAQLDREPEGLTMGQLSRRMMVSNGNVTGLVDRLVENGLAERVVAPGDRRAQIARLTTKGRAEFDAMTPVHHEWVHRMLEGVSREELETLLALLSKLKRSVLDGEGNLTPDA